MTNERKIRIFYVLSMIGMIIGLLTVGFCLIGFSVDDYGIYNLYNTFCMQLGVLSFGFQDGMLINYRKKNYTTCLPTLVRDLKFGIIFQTTILIICLLFVPIIKNYISSSTILVLIFAIISFYPITLLGNVRNAFSAMGKFDLIGVVDFIVKLYLFISIILVVLFKWNVYVYIVIDIIAKLLIVIWLYFIVYRDYQKLEDKTIKNNFQIIDNFKKGLWILLGNWAFILVFSLDRSMLANHPELIGIYSYGMFVISTIFQFLTPIKSVFVSQIDENMSNKEIYLFVLRFSSILFVVTILYLFLGVPIINSLLNTINTLMPNVIPTLSDIQKGINLSSLLVVILPMYVVINIFFNAMLLIKNQKKYAFAEIGNVVISLVVYIVAINIFKANILLGVVFGSIANYFISFIYNMLLTSGFIETLKIFIINGLLLFSCLLALKLNNSIWYIFLILVSILLVGYAHKKLKMYRMELKC